MKSFIKQDIRKHHGRKLIVVGMSAACSIVFLLAVTLWFSFVQFSDERHKSASFYTNMVQSALTRTIESAETSLVSLSDVGNVYPNPNSFQELDNHIAQIQRFAPHIRQILLEKNSRILFDSIHRLEGSTLDLKELKFPQHFSGKYSLGLKIGYTQNSRFFPVEGGTEHIDKRRAFVPLAFDFQSNMGEEYRFLASLNISYLMSFLSGFDLQAEDEILLVNFDAVPLFHKGDKVLSTSTLESLVHQLLLQGKEEWLSSLDPKRRYSDDFLIVRLLEKYPLAVVVRLDKVSTLQAWLDSSFYLISALLLAAFVVVIACIVLLVDYLRSAALREKVRLLSAAIDQSPIPVLIADKDYVFNYVNAAYTDVFGLKAEDVIGKSPGGIRSGLPDISIYQAMSISLDKRAMWQGEFTVHKPSGRRIPVEASVFPVWSESSDNAHVISILNDVSLKRQDEDKIRLLSRVIEQSPAIVVITNSLGDIEYVNERFVKTTGYQLQDVVGKNPRILKSGETTDEDYLQMWGVLSTGGVWSGEFHNKAKDGTLYWERAQISSITDKRGNITHYIAIKEEVTKRKDDEKRLRLASAVFETAAEAIMVSDHNNRIQMINHSFTVITGYESEQVIGENPSVLSSGYHGTAFYQDMYSALGTVGIWEGEVWNRRKNGEIYPQWLTISTMRDEQGVLEGYVSLFSDMTRRKKDEEYIIQQANFDTLTGLPNRNLFSDRLTQSVARAQRSQISSALLFIDLDRFKYVNDTLGHLAGDELLKQAARRLESCLRAEDTAARLGGDEFAVILLDVHSSMDAQRVVKKILLELSEPYYLGEHEAFISGSIGITLFPDDGDKPELLIRNADSAMYKAKEAGRNDFYFFTPQMNEEAIKRRDLEMALYLALEREQFLLHYQPIVDINTGDIVSAEALIRWNHPTLGVVSPADFIPLAEEIGLIKSIGEWVLRKACNEALKWQTLSGTAPKVSVNVSSRQFQRQDMALLVRDILTETGLPPNLLTLEITESLLVSDVQAVTRQLSDIAKLGVSIAIDDFGTGYSSLSYLKKFPISILKIDRSFIGDLLVHEGDQTLVNGIISLANSLGLKVVAEGVEEEAQHMILKMLECDYVQGYYFHYPLTDQLFIKLLQSRSRTLIQ